MLCPYCLQNIHSTPCEHCKERIPERYIQRHKGFQKKPAILSAVGFTGHGKTVYLAAMLYALEQQMLAYWPRFYRQSLDVDTVKTVQTNLGLLESGELPKPTRKNFPKPSIHLLANIPDYDSRTLLIYDPPGEAFDTDTGIEDFAHYVKRAHTILFLVSLADLQPPKYEDLYRLLNTYVLGMEKMRASTKQQNLIIAYTKADLMLDTFKGYPKITEHLCGEHQGLLRQPKKYVSAIKDVSGELAHFTSEGLKANNFIRCASQEFNLKNIFYCVVSALGSPPVDGHLPMGMEPRCVIDPLLLVLDMD